MRRARHDHAVCVDEKAVLSDFLIRAVHEEARRDDFHFRLRLDDLKRRPQHIPGSVHRSGHQSVRIPALDHHDSEIHRIFGDFCRLLAGHSFHFSKLIQRLRILRKFCIELRIHDADTCEIGMKLLRLPQNVLRLSQKDRIRYPFSFKDRAGFDGTRFQAFRKDDRLSVRARFLLYSLNHAHLYIPRYFHRKIFRSRLRDPEHSDA